jgi:hypothetical protein
MSYNSHVIDTCFVIEAKDFPAVIEALTKFDKWLETSFYKGSVLKNYKAEIDAASSIPFAFRYFGWEVGRSAVGVMSIDYADGMDNRDSDVDDRFFAAIAKFVNNNPKEVWYNKGHVTAEGEDGTSWRYVFRDGLVYCVDAVTTYEAPNADNQCTVPTAEPEYDPMPLLVLDDGETYSSTDGNAAVLMIDGKYYNNDECADINDASDLPVDVILKRIPITDLLEAYAKVEAAKLDMEAGFKLLEANKKDNEINLEALVELFSVADDEECAMLDRLATKAGLMWGCPCGATTYGDLDECFGCNAKRGEGREDSEVPGEQPESDPQ